MRAGLWPDAAMPVQAMQDELREAVLVAERALLCALGFDLTRRCLFRRCRTSCARQCWWRGARCCARWGMTRRAAVPVQAMQDELRKAVLVAGRALLCALGFDLTRSGACPGDAGRAEAVLVAGRALLCALGFDLTRGGACPGDAGRAARGGAGGGARAAVRGGV